MPKIVYMNTKDLNRLHFLEQKNKKMEIFSDQESKEFARLFTARVEEFISEMFG